MKERRISSARHLQYAQGYLELGLIKEAAEEIEEIAGAELLSLDVLRFRIDLHMAAKQWDILVGVAKAVCAVAPGDANAWVHWAYALRELQQIEEARDVLLQAEPLHAEANPVIHYNLACYYALLGDLEEAKRRLAMACTLDEEWNKTARADPDLKSLWTLSDPPSGTT